MHDEIGCDRLEQILQSVSQGVICQQADGRVIYINDKTREIFGVKSKKALAHNSADRQWRVIYEDGAACPDGEHPSTITLLTGKALRGQIRGLLWANRPVTWISIDTNPIFGDDSEKPEAVVLTFTDVTEQKRTEELQKRNYRKQHIALDLAKLVQWEYDIDADLFTFDEKFYALYGTSASEQGGNLMSAGEYANRFLPLDEVPVVANEIKAALEATDPEFTRQLEHRILRSDGQTKYLIVRYGIVKDQKGRTTRLYGANQDVTALKAAEERWQFALEGSRDGVWDWDAASDKVFFSRRWKEMLGYDEGDIGDSLEEWDSRVHPDDKPKVYEDLTVHLEGKTPFYQNEHRVLCRDGTYKWVLDQGKVISRLPDGKPARVIGTHTDITERKLAEEQIRRSEERFRIAFVHSNAGIAIADKEGHIQESNSAFQSLAGYSERDLAGTSFRDITYVEDLPEEESRLSMLMSGNIDSYRLAKRYIAKNGYLHWVDISVAAIREENGQPKSFVGIVTSIDEEKRAQLELQQAEHRYRTLFDVSPDGILTIDPTNGQTLKFNRAAHEQLGFTKDEFQRLKIQDYEVAEAPEETRRHIEKILETGRDDFETKHRSKSGEIRDILVTVQRVDIGGQPEFMAVYRDITHIHRAEAEMRDLSSRLLLATRAGNIGVWDWDIATDALTWNEQMFDLYGLQPNQFSELYQAWRERLHPDDRAEAEKLVQSTRKGQGDFDTQFRIVRLDGQVRHLKAAATLISDERDAKQRMIGVNWDITRQKELEDRLRQAATIDSLTGLNNRAKFLDAATLQLKLAKRQRTDLCILMLDIDHFKTVNDTYGHAVGDQVLKSFGATISGLLRTTDICGRVGGEEFAIALIGSKLSDAKEVAKKICDTVAQNEITTDGGLVGITTSIGVACLRGDQELDGLMNRADQALYKAKASGRNRVCSF